MRSMRFAACRRCSARSRWECEMGTRGGRRPGAGRPKGSKNKRKRADLIVRDYEAGCCPRRSC